jgi:ferrous iron transport protein B
MEALEQLFKHSQSLRNPTIRDEIVSGIYQTSRSLCNESITYPKKHNDRSQKLDQILTSPVWGFPIMLALLGIVIYLTIWGANIPSSALADLFGAGEAYLTQFFQAIHAPEWLHGVLVLGLYRGTSWVISVMLPPMAIFFPIFALLENYGYLPRVAFNMDRLFKKSGGHGKQSLTMAMGFGCNAAAIVSTRIIESPRERMIAILTNNFVPCNGRWPTLILLATLFMAAGYSTGVQSLVTTAVVMGIVLFGIVVTLAVSWLLSKTLLRGIPTQYTLELPPYRTPKFLNTIVRATLDKTLFVLKRAVIIAAPASLLTWILANITIGEHSIIQHIVHFLDPFAQLLGMDGFILMAFIFGLPANEIVLPVLLMGYLSTGALIEVDNMMELKEIFLSHGWTWLTALNMMLFSLLHYPCGTTLYTIYKETNSIKWATLSAVIPTAIAIAITFATTQIVRALGLV